jgi:hypothetical protein
MTEEESDLELEMLRQYEESCELEVLLEECEREAYRKLSREEKKC